MAGYREMGSKRKKGEKERGPRSKIVLILQSGRETLEISRKKVMRGKLREGSLGTAIHRKQGERTLQREPSQRPS